MGSNNSNINEQSDQSHERLGLIKILQKQTSKNSEQNSSFIQLKKNVSNEIYYQKWIQQIKQIDSQQTRDVIYLPVSYKYQQTGICTSGGHAVLTFQNFPFILKTEIQNRRKMMQFFQQPQLWYLLYNLVEAGTIFQQKNKKIGDIHPNNCLLNDNGQMKIITFCSLPGQRTNYQKILQSSVNDAYLAPEQIDSIFLQKGILSNIDIKKADSFCIAITLLEAASLQDCYYVYNRGPYKLNKNKLNEYIKIVQNKYSLNFCEYLNFMLSQDPKKRKKCSQVFADLYPYEQQILQLRSFSFIVNSTSVTKDKTRLNTIYEHNQVETVNLGMDSIASPINNLGMNSISTPINNLGMNSLGNSLNNLALNSFSNNPFNNLAINSVVSPTFNTKNPQNLCRNSQISPPKNIKTSQKQLKIKFNDNQFAQNEISFKYENPIKIEYHKTEQVPSTSSSIKKPYVRQFM